MKVSTKFFAFVLSLVMAFSSFAIPAFAISPVFEGSKENMAGNYHVSTVDPRNALLEKGTEPSKVALNISGGSDRIEGNANYSTLYTKYLYYGTRYYRVELTNLASTPLKFSGNDAKCNGSQAVITLGAHKSGTYYFELLPDKQYFSMTFYAPSHFTGVIYDNEPLN